MTRTDRQATSRPAPGVARHLRSILLLPVMNVVVIPSLILALTERAAFSWWESGGLAALISIIVGATLLLSGGVLVLAAIVVFIRHGEGTLAPWDPPQKLVVSGFYRVMRNPMKAGLIILLLAEVVIFRSEFLAAWFALFAVGNIVYIRLWEEPELLRRFGRNYSDYRSSVPRWLPRVGASPHSASPHSERFFETNER